jgi:hypothetical protein
MSFKTPRFYQNVRKYSAYAPGTGKTSVAAKYSRSRKPRKDIAIPSTHSLLRRGSIGK